VDVYRLEKSDRHGPTVLTLKKVTDWRQNYLVRSLASLGDNLVLGDALSSVTVLDVVESKLRIVARDYGPLWPVCVHMVDKKGIIGANVSVVFGLVLDHIPTYRTQADMNLFMFELQKSGAQVALRCTGLYHTADMVTKFISSKFRLHRVR
jgi:DNA damage-binding protein 1